MTENQLANTSELQDTTVLEKPKEPAMYKVILFNDDITPMDFVVYLLVEIFHIGEKKAMDIMLKIHNEGYGICGVYSFEIAETKIAEVELMTKEENYPLKSGIEKV